jgi:hypothetical protein
MEELDAYRQGLLSALESVITELTKTVAGMPTNVWQLPFGQDAHTPHYTLAHLYVLEAQVFDPLLRSIVDEDAPLLPLFDDKAWLANHYEPGKPAQAILEEFMQLSRQDLNWLQALPSDTWSRNARHPWWGVHTLQWWVELQLDCSNQHLAELTALLAM